jgi:hypothetical protein
MKAVKLSHEGSLKHRVEVQDSLSYAINHLAGRKFTKCIWSNLLITWNIR